MDGLGLYNGYFAERQALDPNGTKVEDSPKKYWGKRLTGKKRERWTGHFRELHDNYTYQKTASGGLSVELEGDYVGITGKSTFSIQGSVDVQDVKGISRSYYLFRWEEEYVELKKEWQTNEICKCQKEVTVLPIGGALIADYPAVPKGKILIKNYIKKAPSTSERIYNYVTGRKYYCTKYGDPKTLVNAGRGRLLWQWIKGRNGSIKDGKGAKAKTVAGNVAISDFWATTDQLYKTAVEGSFAQ